MKRLTPGNFPTESVHLAFEYAREGFCLRKEELPYSHWFLVECFCFQHAILASEISRMTATQDSGNKYFELHIERVQIVKQKQITASQLLQILRLLWSLLTRSALASGSRWASSENCVFFCNLKSAILENQIVCFTIWDAIFAEATRSGMLLAQPDIIFLRNMFIV